MADEIKDGTTEVIKDPPDKGEDPGEKIEEKTGEKTGENLDKEPLSDGDDKGQAIQSVLDEYSIDSPEQLGDFLKNLSEIKDQVGDEDLEELKRNSVILKKYQKHWAKKEREKQKEDETPEESIARLEKENEKKDKAIEKEQTRMKEVEVNQRLLKNFNSTVTSAVEANKDVPTEYRKFLSEFLGVNNEINEIGMDDMAGVKRIARVAAKKLNKHNQEVIKSYLKGKTDPPPMSSSDEAPPDKPEKITKKNLKAVMTERLQGFMKK